MERPATRKCAECATELGPWDVEYGVPFCSDRCQATSDARRRTITGDIPDIRGGWATRPWGEPWANDPGLVASAGGITAIGLQRTMCYGTCPVYRLELRRSGRAAYTGEYHVDREGPHEATIDLAEFATLALAIAYLRFEEHQPHYAQAVTCSPDAIVWIRRGPAKFVVSDYAASGPPSLRTIQGLVDQAAEGLEWRRVPSSERTPPT